MSESFPLPTEPEGVIPSLLKRFNSGKIEAMMALYAPEAVFVANDGRTITDRAEFTAILEHDITRPAAEGKCAPCVRRRRHCPDCAGLVN